MGAPSAINALATLPAPSFISDADGLDPNLVLNDMIAAFEAAANRTLQPAQVERLLINLYAYREALTRNNIQWAGQQSLLAFANFPNLDYLGELLGVTRLGAEAASTTLTFTLAAALTYNYDIPLGTQVGTFDGLVVFATEADLVIPAGQLTGSVTAEATVAGTQSNGYTSGQVTQLLSPTPQLQSATNTATTSGGSAGETDDQLRARIQLAPNSFSSAGPVGAYQFFALSADPTIVDISVVSLLPGQVTVTVLTGPTLTQPAAAPNTAAIASSIILGEVATALANVRPLTDTVLVVAAAEVDYQITASVIAYADADEAAVLAAANAAAITFAQNLANQLQTDIVPSQIIAALSVPGVYEVVLSSPIYTPIGAGQFANCTAITLSSATGGAFGERYRAA